VLGGTASLPLARWESPPPLLPLAYQKQIIKIIAAVAGYLRKQGQEEAVDLIENSYFENKLGGLELRDVCSENEKIAFFLTGKLPNRERERAGASHFVSTSLAAGIKSSRRPTTSTTQFRSIFMTAR
jgi:hypothetical protein